MYDAIVIGARCGGSPTAMLLARKGYRVLLVDKAMFPSDTMSTHFIHLPGVALLQRWGIDRGQKRISTSKVVGSRAINATGVLTATEKPYPRARTAPVIWFLRFAHPAHESLRFLNTVLA